MTRKESQLEYKAFKKKCCEFCGVKQHYWLDKKTYERKGNILHVHHIDENKDNNNPDNLITLCQHCHTIAHKLYRVVEKIVCNLIIEKYG